MSESDRNRMAMPEALSRRQVLFGRREADHATKAVAQVGSGCLMADGIACRLCEDSCEAGAFRFRPQIGGKSEVRVDEERCTACGDCIGHCPVGAISIAGTMKRTPSEGVGLG